MTSAGAEQATGEGLRERKKRLMRRRLSDTAARMFMERGFDAVRVADVAEACGVSEKTVFNYFATKEALVLDQLGSTMTALRAGLAEPDVPPVEAVLRLLDAQLGVLLATVAAEPDPAVAVAGYRRFGELIRTTPSLRAHQSDAMDRFVAVAAELLAERAGLEPTAPEPQIAAAALLGLWRVQFTALRTHLDGTRTPDQVRRAVTADVRRAAQLVTDGLASFPAFTTRPGPSAG